MQLTQNQILILELIRDGLSNRLIGERMGRSRRTIDNNLRAIAKKLKAVNRVDCVMKAIRFGLIGLGEPPG